MLADEASLVAARVNGLQRATAVLQYAAVSAILSKAGGDHFKKLLRSLED